MFYCSDMTHHSTIDLDTRTGFAVLLIALVAVVLQMGCDSGDPIGNRYDEPVRITSVDYQSPDSAEAPTEINPGDLVVLKGENMDAVSQVYFNGEQAEFNPALASRANLIVRVPDDLPFGEMDPNASTFGYIKVANNASADSLEFPVIPPPPILGSMSNEQAFPGTEQSIYGAYLYQVQSITMPDGTVIPGAEVDVEESGGAATFVIPPGTLMEEGAITYETISGTAKSTPRFAYQETEGMLLDFDELGGPVHWQLFSALYSGEVYEAEALRFRDGAKGDFAILGSETGEAIEEGANQWWTGYRSINLQPTVLVPPAQFDGSLADYAMKFEVNTGSDEWSTGTIEVAIPGTGYAATYRPWLTRDGDVEAVTFNGWRTVMLPLSEFKTNNGEGTAAPDFATLLGAEGNPGRVSIRLDNNTVGAIPGTFMVAVDNIRLARIGEATE